MSDFVPLVHAVVEGDRVAACRWTEHALAAGEDAALIVRLGLLPAMDEVARRFANNDYFMPELLVATRTLRAVLELLRPHLALGIAHPAGVAVIVAAQSEAHGLTSVLLSALLEGAGFSVAEVAHTTSTQTLVAAVHERQPCLVCVTVPSAAALPQMRGLLDELNQSRDRAAFKIMVVGAAVTARDADEHGADAQVEHALAAIQQARFWFAS